MAERVVERAGRAGEHQLAGAPAQRLLDGELAVGDVLAHRVADELDPLARQSGGRCSSSSESKSPTTAWGTRPSRARKAAPPSAASRMSARAATSPVPGGVAVLAVEEHDGERATPLLRARPAHAISRRGSGNAAS